jgi:hypothetical protein
MMGLYEPSNEAVGSIYWIWGWEGPRDPEPVLTLWSRGNPVFSTGNRTLPLSSHIDLRTVRRDRLCGLMVRVPGHRYKGSAFDSRRYQIFWEVVGLERGPLSHSRPRAQVCTHRTAIRVKTAVQDDEIWLCACKGPRRGWSARQEEDAIKTLH